jgi:hypothetical protein
MAAPTRSSLRRKKLILRFFPPGRPRKNLKISLMDKCFCGAKVLSSSPQGPRAVAKTNGSAPPRAALRRKKLILRFFPAGASRGTTLLAIFIHTTLHRVISRARPRRQTLRGREPGGNQALTGGFFRQDPRKRPKNPMGEAHPKVNCPTSVARQELTPRRQGAKKIKSTITYNIYNNLYSLISSGPDRGISSARPGVSAFFPDRGSVLI